jgi:hypothetical protein
MLRRRLSGIQRMLLFELPDQDFALYAGKKRAGLSLGAKRLITLMLDDANPVSPQREYMVSITQEKFGRVDPVEIRRLVSELMQTTIEMGVWTADGGRSTSHDPFVFGVVILNAQPNTVHVKFRISYSLMRILEQPGLRRKFDLVTRPVVQQMASPSIVPLQTRLGGPRSA